MLQQKPLATHVAIYEYAFARGVCAAECASWMASGWAGLFGRVQPALANVNMDRRRSRASLLYPPDPPPENVLRKNVRRIFGAISILQSALKTTQSLFPKNHENALSTTEQMATSTCPVCALATVILISAQATGDAKGP